jgi:hypothetical protein
VVDFGRQMDAAAINWTPLVIDHLNPSSSIWPIIVHVIASVKVKGPGGGRTCTRQAPSAFQFVEKPSF